MKRIVGAVLTAVGVLALIGCAAAPSAASGPGFSCARHNSVTQEAICRDEELSAYERAMAFARSRRWESFIFRWGKRKAWLARRDACAERRDCIRAAYREWIDGLDSVPGIGPSLDRRIKPPSSDDLMLGSLQSPTGEVSPLGDDGSLTVHALGDDWFVFQATAAHFYDPHDGLGANASTSDAVGVVHLRNGMGRRESNPGDEYSCGVGLTRYAARIWKIEETGYCGGMGSTLTGIYAAHPLPGEARPTSGADATAPSGARP